VVRQANTYIVGSKDRCSAQGEQGEGGPLEVNHCAGFRRRKGGVMMKKKRRREKEARVGVLEEVRFQQQTPG